MEIWLFEDCDDMSNSLKETKKKIKAILRFFVNEPLSSDDEHFLVANLCP